MGSVSSEIKFSAGNFTSRVEGIDVNTFERDMIDEFRKGRSQQGRGLSSFELHLGSDGVSGGAIFAKSKTDLEEFRDFLLKTKGFELRDDLEG